MMNIQSTSAADAAGASKPSAAKKEADSADGFNNAMAELDQDAGSARQGEGLDAEWHEAGAGEGTEQPAPLKKPIIDIRQDSLRKQVAQLHAMPSEPSKAVGVAETDKASTRGLTAAEKKLKDALALAKALTQGTDAPTKDLQGEAEDVDIDALRAADDTDGKLADVFHLLNADTSPVVAQSMAQVLRSDPQPNTKKTMNSTDADRTRGSASAAINALSLHGDAERSQATVPGAASAPESDRLFRFEGARGGRGSVEMSIGESRGDRTVELREASGGQAETVTVLDSRRYLGLAPNSAALTAALSGDKEWASAMQPASATANVAAQTATGSVVHTLKLQMNPHDLGSVTAMLRLRGEELNVHLTVETRAAYRQLAEDSNGIVDTLRAQGFAVDQVTISIAASASSDETSNQQPGQGNQQTAAQGERQGNTGGRGQEGSQARPSQQAGHGHDSATDHATAPSAGSARPGQLYL